MNANQQALLMLKGMISDLPESDQKAIHECAEAIRVITSNPNGLGLMAMALVGAELQAKD